MPAVVLLFALSLGATAVAEDNLPLLFDIRFRGGLAPGLHEQSAGAAPSSDFDDQLGYVWGMQGLIRHRLGRSFGYAMLLGFHVVGHYGEQDVGEKIETHYVAAGGEFGLGVIWQFNPRVHLELISSYGLAKGKVTVETSAGGRTTGDSGAYQAWNTGLGGFYTWPLGLQLGLSTSWYDWTGDSELNGVGVRSRGAGPLVTMTLGYSF